MEFFETLWRDLGAVFGERIQLGTNSVTTLNIIVWSLFIGFIIAIGVTLYNKLVLGRVVRMLIEKQAITPETALSADEIGANNPFIRFALRRTSSFRRVVRTTLDTEQEQAKPDAEGVKFYVPSESHRRAQIVYGKPEASVFSVLLAIIAFLILAMVAFIIIPDIAQLLANFANSIAPRSGIQ